MVLKLNKATFSPSPNSEFTATKMDGWKTRFISFLEPKKPILQGRSWCCLFWGDLWRNRFGRLNTIFLGSIPFFFLPKPISGLNWWGAYNERCENSLCFFIGWYLFFWNLRQTGWDLVGEFLKFEGLNATLPPVVFSKGKQNIMSSTNGTGLMLGKSSYLFHKSIFSYKYQT